MMQVTKADRDAAEETVIALLPLIPANFDIAPLGAALANASARHREQAVAEAVAGIVGWLREQDGHGEWREAADAIDAEFLACAAGE